MVTPAKSHAPRTAAVIFIYVALCAVIGLVLAAMDHKLTFEDVLALVIYVLLLPVSWGADYSEQSPGYNTLTFNLQGHGQLDVGGRSQYGDRDDPSPLLEMR